MQRRGTSMWETECLWRIILKVNGIALKKKRPVSAHVQLPNGQPRHCHFEKWARSIEITLAIEDNDFKNAIPNEYK